MTSLLKLLKQLNIAYRLFTHPPVFTCNDSSKIRLNSKGAHTKNLFLKTEKPPHKYFLYTLECHQRANLKKLVQSLSPSVSSRLTFANNHELKTILGLTPGSVSPLGLINDKSHQVTFLIDRQLTTYNSLLVHPNDNRATIELSLSEFKKFLSHTHHHPQYL